MQMATFERLANNEVKYTITVEAATFDKAMAETYIKTRKRYSIPGFRKGKAPRAMIERHYGEGVFYEDAFQAVYWDAYAGAVKESNVTPVDQPDLTVETIGQGVDLVFTAQVPIRPEISVEPDQYRGIELERVEYNVSESDVDRVVERERERLARFHVAERPIQNGDQVKLDYAGSIDGVAFPGGTAEDQMLEIGSGRFIPGFEEQMIGMSAGEERDLDVNFPDEYHAEELAGKQAVFHVKVNEIKYKELPELDDEFAKDISDFDTLEAYRADQRAKLEKEAREQSEGIERQRAVDALVERVPFDLPAAMIERQIDYMLNDMRYRLAPQGISLEDYFAYMGLDNDSARQTMRGDAEKKVRSDIILRAVGDAEKLEVSDEELEAEIEALAKNVSKTLEDTKKMLTENDLAAIRSDLRDKKALGTVLAQAVWTDAKEKKEN